MIAEKMWTHNGIEPSLQELLSDPVVIILMQRDGVTRHDIEMAMDRARLAPSVTHDGQNIQGALTSRR